jgi:hypothetical protein
LLLVALAEGLLDLNELGLGLGDKTGSRGTENLSNSVLAGLEVLGDGSGDEGLLRLVQVSARGGSGQDDLLVLALRNETKTGGSTGQETGELARVLGGQVSSLSGHDSLETRGAASSQESVVLANALEDEIGGHL